MGTSRAIRIPVSRTPGEPVANPEPLTSVPTVPSTPVPTPREERVNVGGTQRGLRLTLLFVGTMAALYAGFVLYDRTAPGGTASPTGNGVLLFTVIFLVFAAGGALYSLTPVPRALEIEPGAVVVVGRWGRRRRLPPLELLSVGIVHRYPAGWLSDRTVELVELSGEDVRRTSYVVESGLFDGAKSPYGPR